MLSAIVPHILAAAMAATVTQAPATYSLQVDWIEDDGAVNIYVIDTGMTAEECKRAHSYLIGWDRTPRVECLVER